MTAGILKQDPNTEKVPKNAIYSNKTCEFLEYSHLSSYRMTLKQQMMKNDEKRDQELRHLCLKKQQHAS